MTRRAAHPGWISLAGNVLLTGCSGIVVWLTAGIFVIGVASALAWRITGNVVWVERFFRVPGALAMLWLALAWLLLSVLSLREFAGGELMRSAWMWITGAAVCNLIGTVCLQILRVKSVLNPLGGGSAAYWESVGHLFDGPLKFALLAGGLLLALRVYRQTHFLGRLAPGDWVLLGLFVLFLIRNVVDVVTAVRKGKTIAWEEAANWPTDPLLAILLYEGLVLYRSVAMMGMGLIGRCWRAFSIGVFLTALGDVGSWAEAYGYLPWPWSSITWFVWLPAAASFALAPAYQLEAIRRARGGRER